MSDLQLVPAEIPVEVYRKPEFRKQQCWGWVKAISYEPKSGRLLVYIQDLVFEAKNILRDHFAIHHCSTGFAQIRLDDLQFSDGWKIVRLLDFLWQHKKTKCVNEIY